METTKNYRFSTIVTEIVMIIPGNFIPGPVLLSVREFGENLRLIYSQTRLHGRKHFEWGNYASAWEKINFPSALVNSLIITVGHNYSEF